MSRSRAARYDAFELRKREGGPNELIDKAPADPPRRRVAR